jgi:hypothetical protein
LIKQSFEKRHGVPQIVAGAMNGTHIPLALPAHNEWKDYINHKGWASILFQCVVDGEGNFCNVSTLITSHPPLKLMITFVFSDYWWRTQVIA